MMYKKTITLFFILILSSFLCSQVKKVTQPVKKNQKKVNIQVKKTPVTKESKSGKLKQTKSEQGKKKSISERSKIIDKDKNKKITKTKKITVDKKSKSKKLRSNYVQYSVSKKTKLILKEAKTYLGTPYKFGGNTRKGIDCSAFVKAAFIKAGTSLPRRSIEMSVKGTTIKSSKVKEGDLVFFSTAKGNINHVGIVYKIKEGGIISFIHASSSKGVRIDDLDGSYWPNKYIKAKRVM